MKLAKYLSSISASGETVVSVQIAGVPGPDEAAIIYSQSTHDLWITDHGQDDGEHLGIGAAMAADVIGLEFLDDFRRRMPQIQEDYPAQWMGCEYFALEVEYDS